MWRIWRLFGVFLPKITLKLKNNLKAPLNGLEGVKIALADDYFQQGAEPEVIEAVTAIAERLGVTKKITIPETARARAAAYIITASEGANWHLPRLQTSGIYRLNVFAVGIAIVCERSSPKSILSSPRRFPVLHHR